jgi:hypothetical protein
MNRYGRISGICSFYSEIWQNMGAVSTAGLKLKAAPRKFGGLNYPNPEKAAPEGQQWRSL